MNSINTVLGLNSKSKKGDTTISQDLKCILIILFLLVVSVLILYCIKGRGRKSNNEGFDNHMTDGELTDVLLGASSTDTPRKSLTDGAAIPNCIYSSYMTDSVKTGNTNNLVSSSQNKKEHKILSIWRPTYDTPNESYFGDIINIDKQVTRTVNNIKIKILEYANLSSSLKLNLSKMDKNELNGTRLEDKNVVKQKIIINETLKTLYMQSDSDSSNSGLSLNNDLSFNVLKGLGIISDIDEFNYSIESFKTFMDFSNINTGSYESTNNTLSDQNSKKYD